MQKHRNQRQAKDIQQRLEELRRRLESSEPMSQAEISDVVTEIESLQQQLVQ